MSEDSVGRASIWAFLCQREAELARCGAVERPLDSKPGSNFASAKRGVSVLIRFRIENENSGSGM